MIEQGIYLDLSSEDYHAETTSLSRTSIMEFKKNKRKYWAKYLAPDCPSREKTTAATNLGQAFHTLILEPHLFDEQYFVMPEKVLKKVDEEKFNAHKKAEAEAETTSKIVLSLSDYSKLLDMQQSIFSNSKATALIKDATYESSYFWRDEHSGLMLKSRPDILHEHIYVDLKTCDDASAYGFQKSMAQYGNHIQAAMCRDAVWRLKQVKLSACINILVEKQYPHCIGIYIIDPAAIEAGHCEYKQTLLDLKHAIGHNAFDDYEIQTIGLSAWYQ